VACPGYPVPWSPISPDLTINYFFILNTLYGQRSHSLPELCCCIFLSHQRHAWQYMAGASTQLRPLPPNETSPPLWVPCNSFKPWYTTVYMQYIFMFGRIIMRQPVWLFHSWYTVAHTFHPLMHSFGNFQTAELQVFI
jgi:hypothetical protein